MRPLAGTPATSTTEPCNPELNDGRGLVVRDKWRPRRLARRGRLLGRRSGRLAQGHQRVLQSAKIGHAIRATQNSVRARWRRHGHDRCRRGAARQESDDHDWRGPALLIARVCRRGRPQTSFARRGGSAPAMECDFPCLAMPTQPWLQRSRARRELRARYRGSMRRRLTRGDREPGRARRSCSHRKHASGLVRPSPVPRLRSRPNPSVRPRPSGRPLLCSRRSTARYRVATVPMAASTTWP